MGNLGPLDVKRPLGDADLWTVDGAGPPPCIGNSAPVLQYTGASGVSGAGGHDGADHCGLVGVRLEAKAILLGSLEPPGVMGMLWPKGPPCCCHDIFAFEDLRTVTS